MKTRKKINVRLKLKKRKTSSENNQQISAIFTILCNFSNFILYFLFLIFTKNLLLCGTSLEMI